MLVMGLVLDCHEEMMIADVKLSQNPLYLDCLKDVLKRSGNDPSLGRGFHYPLHGVGFSTASLAISKYSPIITFSHSLFKNMVTDKEA